MNIMALQHVLHRNWKLWYDLPIYHDSYKNKTNEKVWKLNLEEVYSITTVEDFWKVFNNIYEPTDLDLNGAYYLFVDGIYPTWSDINNLNGGSLSFKILTAIEIDNSIHLVDINKIWQLFLLSMIGESIPTSKYINGLSLQKNKCYYDITIWFNNTDDKIWNSTTDLLYKLLKKYDIDIIFDMSYTVHSNNFI
jgi:translation initiation factor 4E